MTDRRHVIALCGGVGGAKLAFGLTKVLAPSDLTIVVNTGDDFVHLGLSISPDIDTVAYTLADLADRERGWGRKDETWHFMAALAALGGDTWFNLGDRDLAVHIQRTQRLASGATLSRVTADMTSALGIDHAVVPMSDGPVRTIVKTEVGDLAFQHYFVKERCAPIATGVRYEGTSAGRLSPDFEAALNRQDIAAVIFCPSNPFLSIDPILALPAVRAKLKAIGAPIVAVSPIIGTEALKGPAAKLMRELGLEPGVISLVDHYDGLLDGLVIDHANAADFVVLQSREIHPLLTDAVMRSDADRVRLAGETLKLAADIFASRSAS